MMDEEGRPGRETLPWTFSNASPGPNRGYLLGRLNYVKERLDKRLVRLKVLGLI